MEIPEEKKPNKGDYEYLFSNKVMTALLISAGVVFAAAAAVLIYYFKSPDHQYQYLSLVVAILWAVSAVDILRLTVFSHKSAYVNLCILELAAIVIDLFFIHTWLIAAFSVITPIVIFIMIKNYWIMMDWYNKPW